MTQSRAVFLCLALATALCSEAGTAPAHAEPAAAPAAAPPLTETVWRLVELQGKPVASPDDAGKRPRFVLLGEGGRIEGFGGCNRFSGLYETGAGNRIKFRDIAATMMACPDLDTETLFFEALRQADSYVSEGGRLSLNSAAQAPLARFEAAP